ncbi:MAG TPA: FMN-binding negative transcriptional regulator [Kofleriaceae bacterium]|nr:FMN-binding negative transcriptional regulator [Kofleriaceae bacterium]
MYLPRMFAEDDRARSRALCDENPFATVVAVGGGDEPAGGPEIAHVPCLVDEACARVRLHVARANALARLASERRRMTAVFHGPHCYVTPRWYGEPARQVPTWNYAVVHASGPARVMEAGELRALVGELSARFEAGAAAPWRPEATEPGFVDRLLAGIAGIVIDVDRLEGKFKLSQNRSPEDRARVRAGLAGRGGPGDPDVLALMTAQAERDRGEPAG